MKILITGGRGYIARNLKSLFESEQNYTVYAPSRTELNLLDIDKLHQYLKKYKFDAIIHAATKGGNRIDTDTYENTYIPNILMFENLCELIHHIPVIIFSSGAEFDRRYEIYESQEEDIFKKWPIDPYGLSKNIISRRSLIDYNNIWILRVFGCFNWDEKSHRFIKSSIENIKDGNPIQIHQNKMMDFFYINDIYEVIKYILAVGGPQNINLVYKKKYDLLHIANLIIKYMKASNALIKINNSEIGKSYTGSSKLLYTLPVCNNFIGLEEGIKQTIDILNCQ